ncbi:fumarylacetoacetate hydrolase family protein [Phycisphaerales bacterium AB-hyl4]|uniref:Fumarylacetoacetate hydrolase family protein n=1 Tax=Natronomicrosphaera hydrolytica TaxID=3242702 RepID=A0ABV4U8M1_9BACT
MRVMRYEDDGGVVRYGEDIGDGRARRLGGSPLAGAIEVEGTEDRVKRVLMPIQPSNIFCIGLNYREHAAETGAELPEHPVVFMKPTSAATDPGVAIRLPASQMRGPEVDYECELAVVIGKAGRDIPEARALEHVLGYTCANDVSARRWQKQGGGGQWIRGKSFDTFCPLGPVLVTADEIADPQALNISTTLNGKVMQQHTTGDMIFSVATLIAFLSRDTTLLPGTVILTGTPQGVGMARKPPVFLADGDEVVVEIERIGKLVNPVVNA